MIMYEVYVWNSLLWASSIMLDFCLSTSCTVLRVDVSDLLLCISRLVQFKLLFCKLLTADHIPDLLLVV